MSYARVFCSFLKSGPGTPAASGPGSVVTACRSSKEKFLTSSATGRLVSPSFVCSQALGTKKLLYPKLHMEVQLSLWFEGGSRHQTPRSKVLVMWYVEQPIIEFHSQFVDLSLGPDSE